MRIIIIALLLMAMPQMAQSGPFDFNFDWGGSGLKPIPTLGLTFEAKFNGNLVESKGATLTFARTGVAYNPDTGAQIATGTPRYVTGKSGSAIYIEEGTTNIFADGTPPTTQTLSVTTANSGKWTVSVRGNGSVISSAGTATATGYGVATAGTPNSITVTGAGTVVYTVSGVDANTRIQVENKSYATSWQSSTATRNAETLSFNPTGIVTPTQGTVSAWVYVPSSGSWTNPTTTLSLLGTSTGGNNNRISLVKTNNMIGIYTWDNLGVGSSHTVNNSLAVGWHMLLGSWSVSTLQFYIDGVPQATPISNPSIPSTIGSIAYIGGNVTGAAWLDVPLDSLRIYNRALTAAEVAQLYRAGR